jgi:hypothetical protein
MTTGQDPRAVQRGEAQALPGDYVPNVDRTYAQVLTATVPAASWVETWFSLVSLKGHLQSVPTFAGLQVWAAPSEDGNYRITTICAWDSYDAVEQWVATGWTVRSVLLAMNPPATDIVVELREEVT